MIKRILIIDGNLLIHKSKHVFGDLSVNLKSELVETGIVYGFLRSIIRMNKIYSPCETCIVFDNSMNIFSQAKGLEKSYREEILPEYKADRSHNNDMIENVKLLFRFLKTLPVTIIYPSIKYEADDVVSYLVLRAFVDYVRTKIKRKYEVIIVSDDKDFHQLLLERNNFSVKIHKSKDRVWDVKVFRKKYGFDPDRFVSYLALLGDKGDNIPGVRGYGKVKASQMVKNFRSNEIAEKLRSDQVETFITNMTLIELISDREVVSKIYKSSFNRKKFNFLAKKYKMISFLRQEDQKIIENIENLSF